MNSAKTFIDLRNRFLPKEVRLAFILESPPEHGGYFYDPLGRPSELLFRSMMQCVMGKRFETKQDGLEAFASAGFVLVNPIYTPVDKLPDKKADELILRNYDNFLADLIGTIKTKSVPLLLIKKNICQLLEPKLLQDGFRILNNGESIPFPMHYHYRTFEETVRRLAAL